MLLRKVFLIISLISTSFISGFFFAIYSLDLSNEVNSDLKNVNTTSSDVSVYKYSDRPLNESDIVVDTWGEEAEVKLIKQYVDEFIIAYESTDYSLIPNKSLFFFYKEFERLNIDSLMMQIEYLTSVLPNPAAERLLAIVFEILGSKVPEQALDYALKMRASNDLVWAAIWSILTVWTSEDPFPAYDWYLGYATQSENPLTNPQNLKVEAVILSGLYRADPVYALEKVSEQARNSSLNESTLNFLARQANTSEHYIELINVLTSASNPNLQEKVISDWVAKFPNEATYWISSLSESRKTNRLLKSAFSQWSISSPIDAANWYMSQSTNQDKQEVLLDIASTLSFRDPQLALDWVQEQNVGGGNENVVKQVLQQVSYDQPDFAIQHLKVLKSEQDKLEVSKSIAQSLYSSSPEHAMRFINNSPFSALLIAYVGEADSAQ
ncbi:hypothetical protein [Pseudoalteromonas viridis]|uniref:HEAT repeat domain-containing protein n=1 Tax=Pseudoalteromonas viridis TaxID=339617 RepID=A0ABX7V9Q0_9GAMM|nr:hypothetical protein [Pseudoalteromonas viridis]QTL35388.1 hypothetical protein J5X90_18060 [Pseudoalteromonas viridis]